VNAAQSEALLTASHLAYSAVAEAIVRRTGRRIQKAGRFPTHPEIEAFIASWNDEPGRTEADVRAVLAEAIALLEEAS
jgi:hypothetical protein